MFPGRVQPDRPRPAYLQAGRLQPVFAYHGRISAACSPPRRASVDGAVRSRGVSTRRRNSWRVTGNPAGSLGSSVVGGRRRSLPRVRHRFRDAIGRESERPSSSHETPGRRAPGVARFNARIRKGLRRRWERAERRESAILGRSRAVGRFGGAFRPRRSPFLSLTADHPVYSVPGGQQRHPINDLLKPPDRGNRVRNAMIRNHLTFFSRSRRLDRIPANPG
jgi:hypothetical protein